ncbi:unnamed protein product [Acanthoscelides obtectus]|nr:unnamed protein product [Acanthoscelides obtectus]CAK1645131.1 RING finger protein 37 [Acanthoscelides obtectus]
MMTIPMTLPSGKTVDLTTLEKHTESEISLGRKPCDPFTGLKFDKYKKPVLNPGLKTRIDMFLLQNSHKREFFKLYRTVGGNTTVSDSSKRKYDEISGDDDDKAISKAKRSCNFVSFRDEVTVKLCINCKHENKSFYKLPCRHLYCRRCILEACRNLKCECGKRFSTSDVKKCHF